MGNLKSIIWAVNILFIVCVFWIAVLIENNLAQKLYAGQIRQEARPFNWAEVKRAYDAFLNYPEDENAKLLSEELPISIYNFSDQKLACEVIKYMIEDWDNYQTLEYEALCGNFYAAEVIYRLINISDGASTEMLTGSLSKLIRINPRIFLRILFENGWDNHRLASIIYSPLYLSGSGEAEIYDLVMKMRALQSVSDFQYEDVKNNCITLIEDCIKRKQKARANIKKAQRNL
jgi:hypothetical protein